MKGCKYGTHRIIGENVLPKYTTKLDNNMNIYDNEIIINISRINIDSNILIQIQQECSYDIDKVKKRLLEIVNKKINREDFTIILSGDINEIGCDLIDKIDFKIGDKVVALTSFLSIPLYIDEVVDINLENKSIEIKGKAILFENTTYLKLPNDIDNNIILSYLDVLGVAGQTQKLVREKDSVLIIDASSKPGILCCYEARKKSGKKGKVIGLVKNEDEVQFLIKNRLVDVAIIANHKNPNEVFEKVFRATKNKEVDLCVNCINSHDSEISSILPVKEHGVVCFLSTYTSLEKVAYAQRSIGKDINLMIGSRYIKENIDIGINTLRESENLRNIFSK